MARVRAQRITADYINLAMSAPLLTREEEEGLIEGWCERSCDESLHHLILSFGRMVVATSMRFRCYGLPLDDLIQVGQIGLLEAANRFDLSKGVRFATYASWWVRSSLQDYVLRNWSIVRVGTTTAQKTLFFNFRRLRSQISTASAVVMSDEERQEMAESLNVSKKVVERMEGRFLGKDQSLNAPVSRDEDSVDWMSLIKDKGKDPERHMSGQQIMKVRSALLRKALQKIDAREKTIIEARQLAEQKSTLKDLGHELNLSKERVRQLEKQALEKMRIYLQKKEYSARDLIRA